MKIETSGTINAPLQTVFDCLTDIRYLRKELCRSDGGKKIKIKYDHKDPFGVNKKILFILDKQDFVLNVVENNGRDCLVLIFEPTRLEYKEFLGTFEYKAELEQVQNKTKYRFTYGTSKEPLGYFKVIAFVVRLFLWFWFWGAKRRFIQFVKSKNV
jgi:hypothetical protein